MYIMTYDINRKKTIVYLNRNIYQYYVYVYNTVDCYFLVSGIVSFESKVFVHEYQVCFNVMKCEHCYIAGSYRI